MKKGTIHFIALTCSALMLLNGCARVLLRSSPSLYQHFSEAIFEECDPELAKASIPANLKIMEGLLKSDPENRYILRLLCMGYCGYALLFVEKEDPVRASELYLRAKDYGQKALGKKGLAFSRPDLNPEILGVALQKIGVKELGSFFWFTLSWNGWLNLNLHQPSALGELTLAQDCLERIMDIDPGYFHGLPCVLMGVIYSARSKMLGGDVKKAERFFQKAFELTRRKFFLVHYYYARYYAVRIQDRNLFLKLTNEIEQGDSAEIKGACLINQVIKQRSKELRQTADDLFL
jgi:hypothetical protein